MKNSEESLKNLRDTIKWTKMHIMGVPEGEERKDRKLKEEKKKWLKVLKYGQGKGQPDSRNPKGLQQDGPKGIHLSKVKDGHLKAARKKQLVTYK